MEKIELLERSLNEIEDLRRINEIQSARLGVFDSMMSLFNGNRQGNSKGGVHPDISSVLKKAIEIERQGLKRSNRGNVLVDQSEKVTETSQGNGIHVEG